MVEINPNLVLLDYKNKETWKNSQPPFDVSEIQNELTEIGGVVPPGNGDNTGKPNFLIVWGQKHKGFLNGKMRLMFDDDRIEAKHFPNHFAVTDAVYARAVEWYLAAEQKRQDALMSCDFQGAQNFPDFADYLELHESTLDYFRLPEDANPKRIAAMIPPGYQYLCGLYSYEEIGRQTFFVLQFQTREMLGTESDWNDNRYGYVYHPETDTDENLIDCLGPYPFHGEHSLPVLRIADKLGDNLYRYRQPSRDNIILPMKQLLMIRERLSKQEKSPEYQQKLRVDNFFRRMEQVRRTFREDFKYKFAQAKPVGGGNPTNVPTIKVKPGINKQGKGKIIEI